MTKKDIKLLKVFEAPISYYTLTRDTVRKLKLSGDVTFECDKAYNSNFRLKFRMFANDERMKVVDDLVVIREGNNTRVITDKDLFNFQNDARSMFRDCRVNSLDLSNFNTSKVVDMSCMFYDCHVESLDLSKFDTSLVTNMSFMFFSCYAEFIDISNFNMSNVVRMEKMFADCHAIVKGK